MSGIDWCKRFNDHFSAGGGEATWPLTPEETADCRAWLAGLGDSREDLGTRHELLRLYQTDGFRERGPLVVEAATKMRTR